MRRLSVSGRDIIQGIRMTRMSLTGFFSVIVASLGMIMVVRLGAPERNFGI